MRTFGLIGKRLDYSFSPGYFSQKFKTNKIKDAEYRLFPLNRIEEVLKLKEIKSLKGFNVTIPYKSEIIPFLDKVDRSARVIGAVNTVKLNRGKWIGYNTDVYGFKKSLQGFYLGKKPKRALILGTGGASKAVKYVLDELAISSKFVSRNKAYNRFSYDDMSHKRLSYYRLIINTTPLGTYPKIEEAPNINSENLTPEHLIYDLVYNPEKTLFLDRAEARGCRIKNGLEMLHLQADRAWEIWNKTSN